MKTDSSNIRTAPPKGVRTPSLGHPLARAKPKRLINIVIVIIIIIIIMFIIMLIVLLLLLLVVVLFLKTNHIPV